MRSSRAFYQQHKQGTRATPRLSQVVSFLFQAVQGHDNVCMSSVVGTVKVLNISTSCGINIAKDKWLAIPVVVLLVNALCKSYFLLPLFLLHVSHNR